MNFPCIAFIVSDHTEICKNFIKHYQLNPNCFKVADNIEKLRGIDKKTPIIFVNCGNNINSELKEMIEDRFDSVRYMDY